MGFSPDAIKRKLGVPTPSQDPTRHALNPENKSPGFGSKVSAFNGVKRVNKAQKAVNHTLAKAAKRRLKDLH